MRPDSPLFDVKPSSLELEMLREKLPHAVNHAVKLKAQLKFLKDHLDPEKKHYEKLATAIAESIKWKSWAPLESFLGDNVRQELANLNALYRPGERVEAALAAVRDIKGAAE